MPPRTPRSSRRTVPPSTPGTEARMRHIVEQNPDGVDALGHAIEDTKKKFGEMMHCVKDKGPEHMRNAFGVLLQGVVVTCLEDLDTDPREVGVENPTQKDDQDGDQTSEQDEESDGQVSDAEVLVKPKKTQHKKRARGNRSVSLESTSSDAGSNYGEYAEDVQIPSDTPMVDDVPDDVINSLNLTMIIGPRYERGVYVERCRGFYDWLSQKPLTYQQSNAEKKGVLEPSTVAEYMKILFQDIFGKDGFENMKRILTSATEGELVGVSASLRQKLASPDYGELEKKLIKPISQFMELQDNPKAPYRQYWSNICYVQVQNMYHELLDAVTNATKGDGERLQRKMKTKGYIGTGKSWSSAVKEYFCSKDMLDMEKKEWDDLLRRSKPISTLSEIFGPGVLLLVSRRVTTKLRKLRVGVQSAIYVELKRQIPEVQKICTLLEKNLHEPLRDGDIERVKLVKFSRGRGQGNDFLSTVRRGLSTLDNFEGVESDDDDGEDDGEDDSEDDGEDDGEDDSEDDGEDDSEDDLDDDESGGDDDETDESEE